MGWETLRKERGPSAVKISVLHPRLSPFIETEVPICNRILLIGGYNQHPPIRKSLGLFT